MHQCILHEKTIIVFYMGRVYYNNNVIYLSHMNNLFNANKTNVPIYFYFFIFALYIKSVYMKMNLMFLFIANENVVLFVIIIKRSHY